ncbi:MAG: exo-alpha-sialidase [Victivallales bacterium]|nr:exo-alpha-sialidase [Victivallales bacterium]
MEIIKQITVCFKPYERFGYFGWPSITKQADGTLVVAASGLRFGHICPWGRSVVFKSRDNGETWTEPLVVNNTPLDDRDTGIVSLGGKRLAITWFTSNTLNYWNKYKNPETGKWDDNLADGGAALDSWNKEMIEQNLGSFIRVSPDGEYWGPTLRAPVNAPHGFIVLKDGSWLYLGKQWPTMQKGLQTAISEEVPISAARSTDEGKTWTMLGDVPNTIDVANDTCESHVVELDNGELLGSVRIHNPLRTLFTRSTDGGRTWSTPEDPGFPGAPAHLLKHSSGAIVCVVGYRFEPFGERARVSYDGGHAWSDDIILRDDAPNGDLGYPASVELDDGSILTIYYHRLKIDQKCGIMGTIWRV